MPSEESRRLLRAFGVAVTEFEDSVHRNEPAAQILESDTKLRARLDEIVAFIERLRRRVAAE